MTAADDRCPACDYLPDTPNHELGCSAGNRWLAQHDAEVAAKALRDAASAPIPRAVLASGLRQWLRERADRIEWEATSE